ncbi:hypothetical protein RBU49_02985 [Clostridium sp. MB40-C1]|uniref:hypothetical protein n=1 Tax=Clostridium sp. MB40-C1 TaxID=3070996 RepID=UPI0027E08A06|nr:hypothetical protein [Clostridium sp. MB40-C1]WMJ81235.1 hypothetical protein RBU49_02985 [Clostridium sp. MB40-C1]
MLLDKNEKVRKELDKYIKKFGVKKVHIARQVGLTGTTIGLFLKGQRELSFSMLEEIEDIMEERM